MHRTVLVAHGLFIEGSHTTKNTASGNSSKCFDIHQILFHYGSLSKSCGRRRAATLSIMTFSITTLNIMTFKIMTLSITTPNKMALSIMTLSIMSLIKMTIPHNDTKHDTRRNDT
jgi:hypothetical protein